MKNLNQLFLFCSVLIANIFCAHSQQTPNQVIDFDGINDNINLRSNVGGNIRTIELWFKLDTPIDNTLSNFRALVVRDTPNQHNELFIAFFPSHLGVDAGRLVFGHNLQSTIDKDVRSNANSWQENKWYHVAGVIDPIQGLSLYIDGIKQSDTDTTTAPTQVATQNTYIGSWGNVSSRNFRGKMDDIHFSTIAKYNNNFVPICSQLKADTSSKLLLNFESGLAITVVDSSGNLGSYAITGATKIIDTICKNLVGIEKHRVAELNLLIFPNPVVNYLNINFEYDLKEEKTYRLFDVTGKEYPVSVAYPNKNVLDVRDLPSGVYFLQLNLRDGRYNIPKRFIKM